MKRSLLIALVALVLAASCAGSNEQSVASAPAISPLPSDNTDLIAKLEKSERDWVAAIVAKDTATIERLLADDFSGTTNEQRYSKTDAVEDVKSGTHESLDLDEIDVRIFGDTAVTTMVQNEKSRHDKEDFSGRYFFTNVWVKRNGEWRAVSSHGSRAR